MDIKYYKKNLYQRTKPNFEKCTKKYKLKENTSNECELRRVCNYPINPRDSKMPTRKGFINNKNGYLGGSHWTCFCMKDKKSFCFDSF